MIVNRPLASEAVPYAVLTRYIFAPGNGSFESFSNMTPETLPVV